MNRFRIADWRMFHAGPTHSGAGTGSPLLSPSLYWKFNTATGLAVRSSPAVVVGDFYRGEGGYVIAGAVYIGSDDGNVYALNAATGIPLWKYVTGGSVSSSPAVVDGKVYIGSLDKKVYCLNAGSGAVIWSCLTSGVAGITSSPAVVDCKVYIGTHVNYVVYCLDAATGAVIWNQQQAGNVETSSPAVVDCKVYIGKAITSSQVSIGTVECLNAASGAVIWGTTFGSVYSSPAVAGGVVYVGSSDHSVYALNAATGSQLWKYVTGGPVSSSPAVVNGVVYVGSSDGYVYALGTQSYPFTDL